jgi:hypothetical protein
MFHDQYGDLHGWVLVMLGMLVLVLGFGLCIGGCCLANYQECRTVHQLTGLPTQWTFWGGCFVTVGDRTVPLDTWRLMEVK